MTLRLANQSHVNCKPRFSVAVIESLCGGARREDQLRTVARGWKKFAVLRPRWLTMMVQVANLEVFICTITSNRKRSSSRYGHAACQPGNFTRCIELPSCALTRVETDSAMIVLSTALTWSSMASCCICRRRPVKLDLSDKAHFRLSWLPSNGPCRK